MIKYHTVRLEDGFGREICIAKKVVSNDVRSVFKKFQQRACGMSAPVIFVDGHGYTSEAEFNKVIRIVNAMSTFHGGRQIY